jgi:hypothetical protein
MLKRFLDPQIVVVVSVIKYPLTQEGHHNKNYYDINGAFE